MSISSEFKEYGEILAEQGKLALASARKSAFAVVGAGDAVLARAAEQGKQFAARTQEVATSRVDPAEVRKTVESYLQAAGDQAATAYAQLSKRGQEVVHEFRKDPRVQRVILRTERAVDSVEDTLEDLLDDVASTVDSDVADAKDAVAEGADKTRATVRKTAARNTNARKSTTRKAPARKAPARKA